MRSPYALTLSLIILLCSLYPITTQAEAKSFASRGSASNSTSSVPRQNHVILVVLENKGYEDVIGSPAMPYLNRLISQYGVTDNFYANFHPSIDNYFMATAGDHPAGNDDHYCDYTTSPDCHPADNIVRRLMAAGLTWKVYAQSIPESPLTHGGYLGGDYGPYLKRHNPVAYFSDILQAKNADGIVDLDQLPSDLAQHRLANWSLIVPDAHHDAHNCPEGHSDCPLTSKMAAADRFLASFVDPILNSSYCTGPSADCLLIIWWDEAQTSDLRHGGGRVAQVFAGPNVKPGYHSPHFYQQPSILRTMLEALGIDQFPGASAAAPSMTDFFKAAPR